MEKNKSCPLKLKDNSYFGNCDKEDCAWYCQNTEDCAVADIANHIRWIANIGVKTEDREIL